MTALAEETSLRARAIASAIFFPANAERVANVCRLMSERFLDGGRLLALGVTPVARSDARHVAVEFVHPVIVGKRALPALAVTAAAELALLAEPRDIVLAFGEIDDGPEVPRALADARRRGVLTIAFAPIGAQWTFDPPSDDPFIRQELGETTYHVLWELVHVFFEHRAHHTRTAGASSFLYPFLSGVDSDDGAVSAEVRESVLLKAVEVQRLREQTAIDGAEALQRSAAALRATFAHGGRVLALGNGGSATDATDLVADLVAAGLPAIDLTADSAVITAIANDIGPEAIFARQVIAYGRAGDVLVALSTSGNSPSVIDGLAEARRRGLATVALVGYDGGRVAADGLADHIIITDSQHIPRIQEAQATAYHLLVRQTLAVAAPHDQGGIGPPQPIGGAGR